MNHNAFKYSIGALAVRIILPLLCCTSCKKFVQVDAPASQLSSVQIYSDPSTATAALSGLYVQLRSAGILDGNTNFYMSFYADELISYSPTGSRWEHYYTNSIIPTNTNNSTLWAASYNQIFSTNAIIEGIERSPMLPRLTKDQIKGESLFIRAFIHFYLVNLFGPIPYVDTTDYMINKQRSRMAVSDVYEHLIADLLEAKSVLPAAYPSTERGRVNKWTATALLARVYLYHQDWAAAQQAAAEVIDQTSLYAFVDHLDEVFVKESAETLWQLVPAFASENTTEASIGILVSTPVPSKFSLSPAIMDAFESGDARKAKWVGTYSDSTGTWYFPFKFKERTSTESAKEYPVIMRLTEQYLIRSEARARLLDFEGAREDLNKIRTRAGLGGATANTQESLLSALLHERQTELFFELAHRWYDLKRMGKADAVLVPIKPGWNASDTLLPIPESELLINKNLLPQTPGY